MACELPSWQGEGVSRMYTERRCMLSTAQDTWVGTEFPEPGSVCNTIVFQQVADKHLEEGTHF